jgi:hypothetical protein
MNISRMMGCCLFLFGLINVLHEIFLRGAGIRQPGVLYALVTAGLFTLGTALLLRPAGKTEKQ